MYSNYCFKAFYNNAYFTNSQFNNNFCYVNGFLISIVNFPALFYNRFFTHPHSHRYHHRSQARQRLITNRIISKQPRLNMRGFSINEIIAKKNRMTSSKKTSVYGTKNVRGKKNGGQQSKGFSVSELLGNIRRTTSQNSQSSTEKTQTRVSEDKRFNFTF